MATPVTLVSSAAPVTLVGPDGVILDVASSVRSFPGASALAFLGDSRIEIGSVPTAYTSSAVVSKSARGLQFWIESLSGGRITCPNALNFGVGGENTTQVLARTAAAVIVAKSSGAAAMVVLAGTNDRTAGLSYETTVANMAAIEDLITKGGLICIWVAELPRGMTSDTSKALVTTQLAIHTRVEQWQADRRGRPGVYVARPWASLADTSSVANAALGYAVDTWLYDGLHPAPIAAHRIVSRHLLPIINGLFPASISPLIQSAADVQSADNLNGAINLNPLCLGSGGSNGTNVTGTVANGYTAQCNAASGGTVAAVASIVNGKQRFVFSGTAGAGYDTFRFRHNTNVGTRGVAVGALYKGSLAFSMAAGQTGIAGIAFYMAGNNIDFVAAGQATQSTGTTPDLYPVDAIDGVAVGEPAALPASSTDIAIGCRIIFRQGAAVSATIDVSQVSGRLAA